MNKKNSSRILAWAAVFLWMGIIFAFSAQPAEQSAGLSSKVTENIIALIGEWIPIDIETISTSSGFGQWEHIVRKMAHGFVYLVLGALTMHALKKGGRKGWKTFGLALLICVLYAISDEVHQIFVPGRAGQIKDVLIDSGGALIGIGGRFIYSNFIRGS